MRFQPTEKGVHIHTKSVSAISSLKCTFYMYDHDTISCNSYFPKLNREISYQILHLLKYIDQRKWRLNGDVTARLQILMKHILIEISG